MPKPLEAPGEMPFLFVHDTETCHGHVLLVHGFTSTPFEHQGLGRAIAAAGYTAHGILLPGHGTDPEELNKTTFEQWREYVRRCFDALPPTLPRFVVGSSMGGALSIVLAIDGAAIDGLILLAPALVLRPTGKVATVLASLGLGRVVDSFPKADPGGDLGNDEGRRMNNGYPVLPLQAIAELERARVTAYDSMNEVHCPLMVVHGTLDGTVDPDGSLELVEAVGSGYVEHLVFPNSQHILGLDNDRDEIIENVVRFCDFITSAYNETKVG